MNKFQTKYNEERENRKLTTSVTITDKTLILVITDGISNVVSVKNVKNNNSEMAYNAAFEDAVRNFFQMPEESGEVNPIVAEMMPTEEELLKQTIEIEIPAETTVISASEIVPSKTVPMISNEEDVESIEPNRSIVSAQDIAKRIGLPDDLIPEHLKNAICIPENDNFLYELPIEPNISEATSVDNMVLTSIMTPVIEELENISLNISEPITADAIPIPVSVTAATTNPVQEAFNASNPVYCDESQIGIGSPAKTLISFGMGAGRTIEECSDTEIMWYLNNIQSTSKFANLLSDMREYAVSKGWVS